MNVSYNNKPAIMRRNGRLVLGEIDKGKRIASKIYLFNFNNYYNRKVKILTESELSQNIFSQDNINFIKADGITTSQVINYPETEKNPDYAVVTDVINGQEKITSRWYVMESGWQRLNQYVLTLRRDVMADYWSDISTCTAHIYKGYVSNNSPLIFNSENTILNKIKSAEILLKDRTQTPWIVGYVGAKAFEGEGTTVTIKTGGGATIFADTKEALLSEYPGSSFEKKDNLGGGSEQYSYEFLVKGTITGYPDVFVYYFTAGSNGVSSSKVDELTYTPDMAVYALEGTSEADIAGKMGQLADYLSQRMASTADFGLFFDYDNNIDDQADANKQKCSLVHNSVAKVGAEYYKMNYEEYMTNVYDTYKSMTGAHTQLTWLKTKLEEFSYDTRIGTVTWLDDTTKEVSISNYTSVWSAMWKLYQQTYSTGAMKTENIEPCEDAPYYMFCIPYNKIKFRALGAEYNSSPDMSYTLANELIKQFGTNLYDIQILPYFPAQELAQTISFPESDYKLGYINLTPLGGSSYTLLKSVDGVQQPTTFIYWSNKSTFSFSIAQKLELWDNIKAQNETELVRLCSPNYASFFEFSTAKNRGVNSFNVDCNYKPGIPYIHVCPYFNANGLYGNNYKDARGLICSGDFSMTQVQNQFINYQLQNKNYNLIFDRQMQSLDLKNKIGRQEDIYAAIAGSLSGAVTGARAGYGMGGGAVGTAIGGITGASLSAIGGALDYKNNQALRADAADSARTLFDLNIGNIQATPDTLTKVSAQNQNNKYFPFVEIYKSTQEELDAFINQIKYSGMTVGVIDTLNKWYNPNPKAATNYIQADLIRLEIPDDNHVIATIADELRKGVYIVKV